MNLRKKFVAAVLAAGVLFAMGSVADAADGVCGGVGTYNPVTGECE